MAQRKNKKKMGKEYYKNIPSSTTVLTPKSSRFCKHTQEKYKTILKRI